VKIPDEDEHRRSKTKILLFKKKALPILTVVTLSRGRYSQRRTNPLCRPKDNFSAQAKLRDRFQLHQFCERVEAETAIPTPKTFRLVQYSST
jgi:hypothetical protein